MANDQPSAADPYSSRHLAALVLFLLLIGAILTLALYKVASGQWADREPTNDQLFAAVSGGDVEGVRKLLSDGANLHALNADNLSPLAVAAREGHLGVVEALLEHGADPRPGLLEAVANNRLGVLQALIARKALTDAGGIDGARALAMAIEHDNRRAVEMMLAGGAGGVPLHHAARLGRRELVELMLRRKISSEKRDEKGWSAADAALSAGHLSLAERLIKAGAPDSGFRDLRAGLGLAMARRFAEAIGPLERAADRAKAAHLPGAMCVLLDGSLYEIEAWDVTLAAWRGECYREIGQVDKAKEAFSKCLLAIQARQSRAAALGMTDGEEVKEEYPIYTRTRAGQRDEDEGAQVERYAIQVISLRQAIEGGIGRPLVRRLPDPLMHEDQVAPLRAGSIP